MLASKILKDWTMVSLRNLHETVSQKNPTFTPKLSIHNRLTSENRFKISMGDSPEKIHRK